MARVQRDVGRRVRGGRIGVVDPRGRSSIEIEGRGVDGGADDFKGMERLSGVLWVGGGPGSRSAGSLARKCRFSGGAGFGISRMSWGDSAIGTGGWAGSSGAVAVFGGRMLREMIEGRLAMPNSTTVVELSFNRGRAWLRVRVRIWIWVWVWMCCGAGLARGDDGEGYPVRTADGWTIVVHHYSARGGVSGEGSGREPVVLCHGLGFSASFFDLDAETSLARDLAGRGFDVWSVSLRGSGFSQKWVQRLEEVPRALLEEAARGLAGGGRREGGAPRGYATLNPRYANWSLDDHIEYDVPAAVGFVRRRTGARGVTWVGHSMGGIVALGHLGRWGNPGISRLVLAGSQMTFQDREMLTRFVRDAIRRRELLLAGNLLGVAPGLAGGSWSGEEGLFYRRGNVTGEVARLLDGPAKDSPSLGQLRQYLRFVERGELWDTARRFNYTEALGRVTVPTLIVAGAADPIATPRDALELHRRLGSSDKAVLFVAKSRGFPDDAGHCDVLTGRFSRREVYPRIAAWIASRDGGR